LEVTAASGFIGLFYGGFWNEEGDGSGDECLFRVVLDFLAYEETVGILVRYWHAKPPSYSISSSSSSSSSSSLEPSL
jgi:hypothetical protein